MMKKAICILLFAATIIAPVQAEYFPKNSSIKEKLQTRHPGTEIVQLTPEEFEKLKRDPLMKDKMEIRKYEVAEWKCMQNNNNSNCNQHGNINKGNNDIVDSEKMESESGHTYTGFWHFWGASIGGDNSGGCCGSGSHWALVVFAIIGAVIVVAWVAYGGIYLYEAITGRRFAPWIQVDAQVTGAFKTFHSGVERYGILYGVKFKMALDRKSNFDLGLVGESGSHYIVERNWKTKIREDLKGAYFLAGPTMSWGFGAKENRWADFYLDLTGGTSTHSDIGLMSFARMGVDFTLFYPREKSLKLGLFFGSMYCNIKLAGSMLRTMDKFSIISGLTLGYQF